MRRDSHDQYEQELLTKGTLESRFTPSARDGNTGNYEVFVNLSNGLYLGHIQRSAEGFWRFAPQGGILLDDGNLVRIAKELQRLNNVDLGITGRIHE